MVEEAVNSGYEFNGCFKLSRQDENLEVKEGVLVFIEFMFWIDCFFCYVVYVVLVLYEFKMLMFFFFI